MVRSVRKEDYDLVLKFGGGLSTRASEDEIDAREAADGRNFQLDLKNRELRSRAPFDLVGTVPNAAEIRGGGSLLKADGTVSTIFQAGDTVYEWDGDETFTSKQTVNSGAKLRGHWRTHNWTLEDKLLLTDLTLNEVVQEWNGTALSDVTFVNEADSGFGSFYAKYLTITDGRAVYSNIKEAGGTFNHLIVGSEVEDYNQITVSNKPSSALSEADPFYLTTPDLKPINGHVDAFGTTIISSELGKLFNLSGSSAKDFSFADFYPGSSASGDESLAYIGNDIILGRQGRIESVRDTDKFGDSEADDLTLNISDSIQNYKDWTIVYNSRLNRVYCFPDSIGECWVFQTAMRGGELSEWMRWETSHPLDFQPTFVMSMLDPSDGLEYVFMGDASGNVYRMEGTGASGDGGTTNVTTEWLTKLHSAPLDAQAYNVEGYVKYKKSAAHSVEITFEYAGENVFNEKISIDIPAQENQLYWGGDNYWGGTFYWGISTGKMTRQPFFAPGQANEMQVRIKSTSTNDLQINEIGLRFNASS